jgi:cell division protein FtsI (penicillin-binding protein 3)
MPDHATTFKTSRLALVMIGITLWCAFILIRLIQLQIVEHESFSQRAAKGQQISRSIHAPRGIIYDSRMYELATSVSVSTAVAEPRRIADIPETAQKLASILQLNPQELTRRMMDPARRNFLVVKRRIDPRAEAQIESLGIGGVYLIDESMRVYPNRELASHTLGFVNMNGDGGAGLELRYDRELKGEEGLYSFDIDARRRSFRVKVDKPPVQGNSLILSIDKSIQYIVDRELSAAAEKANARSGTVIVMESDTGRILALSNYPSFNSNNYNEYDAEFWRNRAVSDLYEPGSTFKVVVAAAALEAGLTHPNEIIDCQMGSITIGRHTFRDHRGYGRLSFSEILEVSSNVGAVKLGLRLGEQRLHEAVRDFGFGSRTGVDLPGEIVGLVRDWQRWSGLSIGAISFGQEVGVTSMQMLTAMNTVANGGFRVRPSIVDHVIDENGDLVRSHPPERVRIMSPRTAETVSNAFEGVVIRGTGKRAALEGYRAAGKTGTAQKIVDGQYSKSKYIASFIGYAPLPHPRITVLVQIDEPKGGYYGGDICAPIFRKISQEIMLQLKVPPDPELPQPERKNFNTVEGPGGSFSDIIPLLRQETRSVESTPSQTPEDGTITVELQNDMISVPDFRGLSKRDVVDRCIELGITLQSTGSGIAVFQDPPPGTKIPTGGSCSVTFKTDVKSAREALKQYAVRQQAIPVDLSMERGIR